MKMHFISGLPRSGSTLLAALLRQNPRFHASIMSPTGSIFTSMLTYMGPKNEAHPFINDAQRAYMLKGMMEGFYQRMSQPVIFDNNRRWTSNIGAVSTIWPDALIFACVRDPVAIVDSFERLFQARPLNMSLIYGAQSNTTVYERVSELMSNGGVVGYSLDALRSAFFGPYATRMLMIEYDQLAQFPRETLADIYQALGEPPFDHDLNNVQQIPGVAEFDSKLDTPGLHALKSSVSFEPRRSILPPDIAKSLPKPFWRLNEQSTSSG